MGPFAYWEHPEIGDALIQVWESVAEQVDAPSPEGWSCSKGRTKVEILNVLDGALDAGDDIAAPASVFTKSRCGLLGAADPSSQSGKAAKARGWGIPIVSAAEFLAATSGAELTGHVEAVGGREAATCARCGTAFTRVAKGRRQAHCDDCGSEASEEAKTGSPEPPAMG